MPVLTSSCIDVIGSIWQPGVGMCAMRYNLDKFDVRNIAIRSSDGDNGFADTLTRDGVESYLMLHSGDFSSIKDFAYDIDFQGKRYIGEWKHGDESEAAFCDCQSPEED
jgi:hypothetical protein